jgi:hypothetical protein
VFTKQSERSGNDGVGKQDADGSDEEAGDADGADLADGDGEEREEADGNGGG